MSDAESDRREAHTGRSCDMTDEQLSDLERLAAAVAADLPFDHDLDDAGARPDGHISAPCGGGVATMHPHGNMNTIARTGQEFDHDQCRYIVAACNAVPALVAEVKRLRAERAWRPIDTAPRDGTMVQLWVRGKWSYGRFVSSCGVNKWMSGVVMLHPDPAHWMPIPAPPTKGEPK